MRTRTKVGVALAGFVLAWIVGEVVLHAFFPLPLWDKTTRYIIRGDERLKAFPNRLRKADTPWYRPKVVYETCFDTRWDAGRDYMDENGCVRIEINRRGWRGPDVPLRRPAGALRIAAVGDSLTFGEGVAFELVWTSVLEELVRDGLAESSPERTVEVIPLAVPAINLPHIQEIVENEAPLYSPDLIVYAFFLNDGFLPSTRVKVKSDSTRLVQGVLTGKQTGLSSGSEVWRRIRLAYARTREPPRPYKRVYGPDTENWARCAEHFRAIRDAAESGGSRFLVALLPEARTSAGEYPSLYVHEWLRAFFEEEGIAWVDVFDHPYEISAEEVRVHPTDLHPNDIGHRMIAETIAPWVLAHIESMPGR